MLLLIAGCSGGASSAPDATATPEPTLSPYEVEKANRTALEDAVSEAISDAGLTATLSEISAFGLNEEYSMTIRAVAAGGAFIPDIAETGVGAAFDKAEELGIYLKDVSVEEYSESNTGDREHQINWRTEDGATGFYVNEDDTVMGGGVTLEKLREMLGQGPSTLPGADTDFGTDLDVFQGEWANEYSSVIVSGNAVNFVHYNFSKPYVVDNVFTYYFVYDEAGALVVVDDVGRRYCTAAVDETGRLVCEHESELLGTKTYEKVSDNTVVPEVTKDPAIGMTEWDVYQSTWGFPKDRNKTTTAYGVSEQWVYDEGYIYFEDGKVTAIQEK